MKKRSTRRQAMAGLGAAFGGLNLAAATSEDKISHTAEAIHQEIVLAASPEKVYEALTQAKQFDKITEVSGAMKSLPPGGKPTVIGHEAGGPFVLFGGHIFGRQIELLPNRRIVQAWRVVDWEAGVYSIAKFELRQQGSGTKIVFDHTGFPSGLGQHLADGWKEHYWEPMTKMFG